MPLMLMLFFFKHILSLFHMLFHAIVRHYDVYFAVFTLLLPLLF